MARTEQALNKLLPPEARAQAIIGKAELAAAMTNQSLGSVPCFEVDARCGDPIDAFVSALGFDRVVLVQGGQDDTGYKFKVASYESKVGKPAPATSANIDLDRAFLGALAKVVPVTATLELTSTPTGATVYVDDVKVGITPVSAQVLPGERVVRFDLKLHEPHDEVVAVPIRGKLSLDKSLDKVAARIALSASPAGTEIFIDGVAAGKDRVDRGIAPGDHVVRFVAEGHKAFEQTISVKAGQQFTLEKALESIAPKNDRVTVLITDDKGNVKPVTVDGQTGTIAVPRPTDEQRIRGWKSYAQVSFAYAGFTGNQFLARRFEDGGGPTGRTTTFASPSPGLMGISAEFGTGGEYVGVSIFGFTWLTNMDRLDMWVGYARDGQGCEPVSGGCGPTRINSGTLHVGNVQLIQPQFRIGVWKFLFTLQAGAEFRFGWLNEFEPAVYRDGFLAIDLLLAARLSVRYYIVEGFYAHVQGHYAQSLWSLGAPATDENGRNFEFPSTKSSTAGLNLGVGYAF